MQVIQLKLRGPMTWFLLGIIAMLLGCSNPSGPHSATPGNSDPVPLGHIPIPVPNNRADHAKLGLTRLENEEFFKLHQLDCEILIIEVFDFYCHVCQSSAENLNTLHAKLNESGSNPLVCMFGIGKENTSLEVDTFRRNLRVSFPLLPDPSALFTQAIQVKRTPQVMILKKDGGNYRIVQQKVGYFSLEDVDAFTELIASLTDQKPH